MAPTRGVFRPVTEINLHGRFAAREPSTLGSPRGVVIHSTESHDRKGLSDVIGVADYLANQTPYEIHVIIDAEGKCAASLNRHGRVDPLRYDHCPPIHDRFFGIELIGFAKFDLEDWWSRGPQLRQLAFWLAYFKEAEGVQLVGDKSTKGPAAAANNGVLMHRQVAKRWGKTDHWDPGYSFPLPFVLQLARTYHKFGWTSAGKLITRRSN